MADTTIVFMGFINQLITGGHHPVCEIPMFFYGEIPKESQLPLDFQLNDFHGDPRRPGSRAGRSWALVYRGKTMGKPWENAD